MAKQVKLEDADRISSLPDEILSHILSFLPTKLAVRTSILSTRWRNLYTFVSNLNFELDDKVMLRHRRIKIGATIKSFSRFVNRVLLLHNRLTCIEKFRLRVGEGINSSDVNDWISAALDKGVQHLDLHISISWFSLRSTLFTCTTLVSLKLEIQLIVLNVPSNVCLPMLKSLHLEKIEFSNDTSVKSLFSSCIRLENVVVKSCYMINLKTFDVSHPMLQRLTIVSSTSSSNSTYWLQVDTPKLVFFKYADHVAKGYSLLNLESLISADVNFYGTVRSPSDQKAATDFFCGISNVKSLAMSSRSLELLVCRGYHLLNEMVQLTMYDAWPWYDKDLWTGELAALLRDAHSLEKLAFYKELCTGTLPIHKPVCLNGKLKSVEIFHGKYHSLPEFILKHLIKFAKYFLKNTNMLEKLIIHSDNNVKERKMKMAEELISSPRKSNRCCILLV